MCPLVSLVHHSPQKRKNSSFVAVIYPMIIDLLLLLPPTSFIDSDDIFFIVFPGEECELHSQRSVSGDLVRCGLLESLMKIQSTIQYGADNC